MSAIKKSKNSLLTDGELRALMEQAGLPANDPLKPGLSLLVKLGSVVVHTEEIISTKGRHFDGFALKTLLDDSEVVAWRKAMDEMAMLPVKRSS